MAILFSGDYNGIAGRKQSAINKSNLQEEDIDIGESVYRNV